MRIPALIGLAAAAASATAFVIAPGPGAAAAATCAKWAATSGSDLNAGTQAAPYRSLGKLVGSLQPGQAGCLPAGQTYFATAGNGVVGPTSGTAAAPVTITSGPGGRAPSRDSCG